MNVTWFALAIVFFSLGTVFVAQAKKEQDETKARNSRQAGILMYVAAALFAVSVAYGIFARSGA